MHGHIIVVKTQAECTMACKFQIESYERERGFLYQLEAG